VSLLATAQGRRAARLLELPAVLRLVANRCATQRGREQLLALEPLTDPEALADLWAHVRELMLLTEQGGGLPLGDLLELRAAIGPDRPHAGPLDPPVLAGIGAACLSLATVREAVLALGPRLPRSAALLASTASPRALGVHLAAALEPDGRIKDGASPKLAALRRAVTAAAVRVREVARREMARAVEHEWAGGPELVLRGERYCIPVTARHRRHVAGVMHDRSETGATIFVEPLAVVEAANELQEARLSAQEEERRIIAALNQEIAGRAPELLALYERVVVLDAVRARALWGVHEGGWAPQLLAPGSGVLALSGFRHPLLNAGLAAAGRAHELIPLDLELGPSDRVLLVSGPNAGGKTVAMKAVGLAVLMAQSGIPLPARAAPRLTLQERVLMDLGDEQSIADALSSFSAHLTNLREIVKLANASSLVLLDEVGGGTDPEEGIALARAVLETLVARRATTVATTHYGQLKAMIHQAPGFRNASMAYDAQELRPRFQLVLDVPGSSHALEIAQRIGLPAEIVERARALVGDETLRLDALLSEMEAQRAALAAALAEAEQQALAARHTRQHYEALAAEVRQTRRQRLDEAQRQAAGIVRGARARIERLLAQMRSAAEREAAQRETARRDTGAGAGADAGAAAGAGLVPGAAPASSPGRDTLAAAAERARAEADALAEQLDRELSGRAARAAALSPARLLAGEWVLHRGLGKEGRIVAVRGGRVTLEVDGLRVVAGPDDLAAAAPADPADSPPQAGQVRALLTDLPRGPAVQIDVRGRDVEDAWDAVDKELDRCVAAGVATVEVIHGKGTGRLRRGLAERLQRDPRVRGAQLGGEGGADDGCTVVRL
jgi:DNA mismatch repair protein MutS2